MMPVAVVWKWFADDDALLSVLSASEQYVDYLESKGITSDQIKTNFDRHYRVLRTSVDAIATRYGRSYGYVGGKPIDLYEVAELGLRGYTMMLHVSELRRKGHPVMI